VSKHTLCAWKAKYGGMDVCHAQEGQFRDDNSRLWKLVADLTMRQ
jgi:putative transposase